MSTLNVFYIVLCFLMAAQCLGLILMSKGDAKRWTRDVLRIAAAFGFVIWISVGVVFALTL